MQTCYNLPPPPKKKKMCKSIAQICSSNEETNKNKFVIAFYTQHKLERVAHNTPVPKFLPLWKLKKQNSNKTLKFGRPYFPWGRIFRGGGVFIFRGGKRRPLMYLFQNTAKLQKKNPLN